MNFGPWSVLFDLEDGARISNLKFGDEDLLTTEPGRFQPPEKDYGIYETRPVYGYDDCFPSVRSCLFPESDWMIPDHGELCWLPWEQESGTDKLCFTVRSNNIPVIFRRDMHFREHELSWIFEVENTGKRVLPFQHVMHPLMPLDKITEVRLPDFTRTYDEINNKTLDLKTASSVSGYLLSRPEGTANMLYLQNVNEGIMSWKYKSAIRVQAFFPRELFPTIGIWWNNSAYPDEKNCRRTECAFEPVPGSNSSLSDAYKKNECLLVLPGQSIKWQIKWMISYD